MADFVGQVGRFVRGLTGLANVTQQTIGPERLLATVQPSIDVCDFWGAEALRVVTAIETIAAGTELLANTPLRPGLGKTWIVLSASAQVDVDVGDIVGLIRLRIAGVPRGSVVASGTGAQAATICENPTPCDNTAFTVPQSISSSLVFPRPFTIVGGSGIGFSAVAEQMTMTSGTSTLQTRCMVYEVDT